MLRFQQSVSTHCVTSTVCHYLLSLLSIPSPSFPYMPLPPLPSIATGQLHKGTSVGSGMKWNTEQVFYGGFAGHRYVIQHTHVHTSAAALLMVPCPAWGLTTLSHYALMHTHIHTHIHTYTLNTVRTCIPWRKLYKHT